jgi:hypothetical protein
VSLTVNQMTFWRRKLKISSLFCGRDSDGGVPYYDLDFDWATKETTDDQKRIEDYLIQTHKVNQRLLHVGIGNSSLAKKVATKFSTIVGISLSDREIAQAEKMNISNYYTFKINKYSLHFSSGFASEFDVIVDNNPNSFCCCAFHFSRLLNSYHRLLSSRGKLLTDIEGIGWSSIGCFQLSPAEWQDVTKKYGFMTDFATSHILISRKYNNRVLGRLRRQYVDLLRR